VLCFGCGALEISYPSRSMKVGDIVVKEEITSK
jgi:hypothetical protein